MIRSLYKVVQSPVIIMWIRMEVIQCRSPLKRFSLCAHIWFSVVDYQLKEILSFILTNSKNGKVTSVSFWRDARWYVLLRVLTDLIKTISSFRKKKKAIAKHNEQRAAWYPSWYARCSHVIWPFWKKRSWPVLTIFPLSFSLQKKPNIVSYWISK